MHQLVNRLYYLNFIIPILKVIFYQFQILNKQFFSTISYSHQKIKQPLLIEAKPFFAIKNVFK